MTPLENCDQKQKRPAGYDICLEMVEIISEYNRVEATTEAIIIHIIERCLLRVDLVFAEAE